MNKIQLIISFLLLSNFVYPSTKAVKVSGHYLSKEKVFAISFQNAPKWHTYWKNPGDAGIPIKNEFFLNNKKINPISIEWPAPKKFLEKGNILTYGYEKTYSLFYKFRKKIKNGKLKIASKWLVCKNICIPGEYTLQFTIENGEFFYENNQLPLDKKDLLSQLKKTPQKIPFPKDLNLKVYLNKKKDGFIFVTQSKISKRFKNSFHTLGFLTPFQNKLITFKKEEIHSKKNYIISIFSSEWDGEYEEPPVSIPSNYFLKTHCDKISSQQS